MYIENPVPISDTSKDLMGRVNHEKGLNKFILLLCEIVKISYQRDYIINRVDKICNRDDGCGDRVLMLWKPSALRQIIPKKGYKDANPKRYKPDESEFKHDLPFNRF
jgi:hypothetical protein